MAMVMVYISIIVIIVIIIVIIIIIIHSHCQNEVNNNLTHRASGFVFLEEYLLTSLFERIAILKISLFWCVELIWLGFPRLLFN